MKIRIGQGYDAHRLVENRPLIIGGANIPFNKGLLGHSDADVLLHAIIDAIFGSVANGNIGSHFPDSDEKLKGVSSIFLLKKAQEELKNLGYKIINIDSTIIAQNPKMLPFIAQMRYNIAEALQVDITQISVKAKTEEGMGFTGVGDGISAQAIVLVEEITTKNDNIRH